MKEEKSCHLLIKRRLSKKKMIPAPHGVSAAKEPNKPNSPTLVA